MNLNGIVSHCEYSQRCAPCPIDKLRDRSAKTAAITAVSMVVGCPEYRDLRSASEESIQSIAGHAVGQYAPGQSVVDVVADALTIVAQGECTIE